MTESAVKCQPAIKWSGSKRSQASEILKHIPKHKKYYEPFVGGASITYALNPSTGICGDICKPLIELWNNIKSNPSLLADKYESQWLEMQNEGYLVYYKIRDEFNDTYSPSDLLFLSRTCVNGLIRFNKEGKFNNSLHHTRKGIHPERLRSILLDWSKRIQGVEFLHGDFKDTTADISAGDFVYLDPPYFNTKGRYYGTIDYDDFYGYLELLNHKGIKYALSFDGMRNGVDYTVELPAELYKRHVFLDSGNSSFKKVMGKSTEMVSESLYLNY